MCSNSCGRIPATAENIGMMRPFLCLLLILTVAFPLCYVDSGSIVEGSPVTGRLTSDTTWSLEQSPIRLYGDLLVPSGVTLTIEPGVTVDLFDHQLVVNGILIARGNQSKIVFKGSIDPAKNNPLYPHGPPVSHIIFDKESQAWNEQTKSGCIIENAVVNTILYIRTSIRISQSSLEQSVHVLNNSSTFSNNSQISKLFIINGTAIVSGNEIGELTVQEGSPTITNNIINGQVSVYQGSSTFRNNTLKGEVSVGHPMGFSAPPLISGAPAFLQNMFYSGFGTFGTAFSYTYGPTNNVGIKGGQINDLWVTLSDNDFKVTADQTAIQTYGVHIDISNNRITGADNSPPIRSNPFNKTEKMLVAGQCGIIVGSDYSNSSASITGNYITNFNTAIAIYPGSINISKNTLSNNYCGIRIENINKIWAPIPNPPDPNITNALVIQENSISNNTVGILCYNYSSSPKIINNDIFGNAEYNFRLESINDTVVADNWWGTIDAASINQTIYDHKYNPRLGEVIFTPFSAGTQTQAGLQLSSQTTSILIAVALVSVVLGFIFLNSRRKQAKRKIVSSGE
ncbi:MAG: right-handed parallel beta-helix repeat-containing protein [Candidatus Bathyarchaeota archaeon]|nr:right-handed parallel beta-helix repeat-containing protein [Candidatus Bathyarchaeota archaeon]